MKLVHVTIVKTVTTIVAVEAKSLKSASDQIKTYGEIEAASDFPVVNETVTAKVVVAKYP